MSWRVEAAERRGAAKRPVPGHARIADRVPVRSAELCDRQEAPSVQGSAEGWQKPQPPIE